jgi:hypothetical protein
MTDLGDPGDETETVIATLIPTAATPTKASNVNRFMTAHLNRKDKEIRLDARPSAGNAVGVSESENINPFRATRTQLFSEESATENHLPWLCRLSIGPKGEPSHFAQLVENPPKKRQKYPNFFRSAVGIYDMARCYDSITGTMILISILESQAYMS